MGAKVVSPAELRIDNIELWHATDAMVCQLIRSTRELCEKAYKAQYGWDLPREPWTRELTNYYLRQVLGLSTSDEARRRSRELDEAIHQARLAHIKRVLS